MNTHVFAYGRPLAASTRIRLPVPRPSVPALRAWLNAPPRHGPMPVAGYMYGLWLRPVERRDIDAGGAR
jgi:hypothetical protein